ncbi:S8 family serine peptidase [Flavobacterium sp. ASW18X]|uniref:S8 family serine peptidase n=1 Tax=Flavobacterium sp. ASW18X TaxID=2572595 RepID=UPI0010AE967B|nr:S8 family serine peptidase [Flavobacterium sp. ASW18X]TKD65272.1 hypothetical protein FBT53_07015 [Flavobacterium sp. ASW18X]
MKLHQSSFIVILSFFIFSCKQEKSKQYVNARIEEDISWHLKDLENDSVPGISLERLYSEYDLEDKGQEVVVALIDSQIDLFHEDIKNQIHINSDEIPNNGMDDDGNGYIDDINGWNFLGIDRYNSIKYTNYSDTRFINAYQSRFNGIDSTQIQPEDKELYRMYQFAVEQHENRKEQEEINIARKDDFYQIYRNQLALLSDRIPLIDGYTKEELDTVTFNNREEEVVLLNLKMFLQNGVSYKELQREERLYWIKKSTINTIGYNDRLKLKEKANDLSDLNYGSNLVHSNNEEDHATQIAGVIAAERGNGLGIRGISNKIKIMPLAIWAEEGAETEKDFYAAVKYAVDNGANIINYSSGIRTPVHPEYFYKALEYAEQHDVLVVIASGNSGDDVDSKTILKYYPIDYNDKGKTLNNVLHVSASNENPKQVFAEWANIGAESVDLLAPGENITTTTKREAKYFPGNGGTSVSAAITSGVAAMLKSHFPKLSAKDLKRILMESGTSYDMVVNTYAKDSIPFSKITKSGKVLNAYSAYKMAEELYKSSL